MPTSPSEPQGRPAVPPPQRSYEESAARALAVVRAQPAEQLAWLGATPTGGGCSLRVLEDVLTVDLETGTVRDPAGRVAGPWWRVLVLHYLSVSSRPAEQPPGVTFADLPGGRAYASVYQRRVIERLCRTAGRDGPTLRRAGEDLAGRVVRDSAEGLVAPPAPPAGDLVMEFAAFPRVTVQLAWYAGDEELTPSAALLLPSNVESFFCLEDIVVLSERLVSRLAGGRF